MSEGVEGFSGVISASAEERQVASDLVNEALQAMGGSIENTMASIAADSLDLLDTVDPAEKLEEGATAPPEITELHIMMRMLPQGAVDQAEYM
jgi:hypothetical protein